MNKVLLWIPVALLAQWGQAQKIFLGSCPSHPVVQNFDVTQYEGVWYEHQKYYAAFEFGQKCITATYTKQTDGTVAVLNRATKKITSKAVSISGYARLLDGTNAKLGVTFPSIPFAPQDSPYWVLDTDYTNYALVWSCNNKGLINTQIVWILTRVRFPQSDVVQKATNKMDTLNIPRRYLVNTDQTGCPAVA